MIPTPTTETPLGRYRLMALLGQGGMADVYLACTRGPGGFQKLLVVKLARFTGDAMFSTMFLDEARLAAQLSHPNVVQTYEIGEEGSRHYIVMEYLDGANLSRLRQKAGRASGIPLRFSIHILAQALEGLEYAHEAEGIDGKPLKVVHRDLSPSNIMITAQGVVKILDFGIAKGVDSHSFTQTGRYSGKLNYMPPEQMKAEKVDARADLFSFGAILAESVLGERLWGNATGPMIAARLGTGDIPHVTDRGTDVDPDLVQICERALAPNREDRYASAADLKVDLLRYLHKLGGPVPQKELAKYVCELVAEDRAKLQAVMDGQLQRISQLSLAIATPPPDLPRVDHTPSGGPDMTIKLEPTIQDDPGVEDIQIITSVRHPMAPASRTKVITLALIAIVAVLGVLFIALLVMRPKSGTTPIPVETARPTPPPPPPAPSPARLEVVVSPVEASLTLDGHVLGTNPFVGSFPRDLQVHELVVAAPGYQPTSQRFALDRDLMLQLHLQPLKVESAAVVTTEPPPPVRSNPTTPSHILKRPTPSRPTAPPRKGANVVATPAPPPVETPPPPPPPAGSAATVTSGDPKRTIDGDVYEKKPTKRALDSNVFDNDQKKPSIDRNNPWKK